MPKLVILYGHPADPATFEDYYTTTHVPFAAETMPGVVGAENLRVLATPGGEPPPYYRVSQLSYSTMDDLRAGIASEAGRAVLADLDAFATGGATLMIADD